MKLIIAAIKPFKLDEVVAAIPKPTQTGKTGDGKIFTLDVASALRVHTGETDMDAV